MKIFATIMLLEPDSELIQHDFNGICYCYYAFHWNHIKRAQNRGLRARLYWKMSHHSIALFYFFLSILSEVNFALDWAPIAASAIYCLKFELKSRIPILKKLLVSYIILLQEYFEYIFPSYWILNKSVILGTPRSCIYKR